VDRLEALSYFKKTAISTRSAFLLKTP